MDPLGEKEGWDGPSVREGRNGPPSVGKRGEGERCRAGPLPGGVGGASSRWVERAARPDVSTGTCLCGYFVWIEF